MKVLFLSDFNPTESLDFDLSFEQVLNECDLIIFNLEGTYCFSGEEQQHTLLPIDIDSLFKFIRYFGKNKFLISIANNHILDNGVENFKKMLNLFESNGINYFGTANKPWASIDKNVAVLTFVTAETVASIHNAFQLNYIFYCKNRIQRQIKELESQYEKLILYPHWGRDMDKTRFKTYPFKTDETKWITIGHHPHIIIADDKEIYSLGNTFIEHSHYYNKYPAFNYGLMVVYDTVNHSIQKYLSKIDHSIDSFLISTHKFEVLPCELLDHGANKPLLKKLFLKVFEFKGNLLDIFKLIGLQLIFGFYKLYRNLLK